MEGFMTLTEQWKKGELPEDDYYIKAGDTILTDFYGGGNFCLIPEKNISEILGKVPNYKEYQALLSDQLAKNEGVEINAELKNSLYSMTQAWQIAEQQAKTLAQTLLKVSPEHREWLENNFKEYL